MGEMVEIGWTFKWCDMVGNGEMYDLIEAIEIIKMENLLYNYSKL